MIVCVDVDYRTGLAVAACLELTAWDDEHASASHVVSLADVAPYEPGAFFRRELPCVEAVLAEVTSALDAIVIDGYVWLAPDRSRPGLGAHLHESFGGNVPVIGVAKNPFRGVTGAIEVLRGDSARPLYVTAEGVEPERAAAHVASMHGEFRVPTLLRRVDRLARTWSP